MRRVRSQFPVTFIRRLTGLIAACLVVAGAGLSVSSAASAAPKLVDRVIGIEGAGITGAKTGGYFSLPRGVAVNTTGAGGVPTGTFYVVDSHNNRIQRFSPSGEFERAWGGDVTLPAGGTDFEICTVAADCKEGAQSGGNGTTAGNGAFAIGSGGAASVAVDSDTGNVFVVDVDGARVNVYDADGAFERSFGFDVVESGPGDTGTGYEVCVQADGDVCKAGVDGAGIGQISTIAYVEGNDVVVSSPDGSASSGKVYLADTLNRRVNVYDLDGSSPSSFGESVFGSGFGAPGELAIDDDVLYASNGGPDYYVERYDLATESFLTPIDVSALPTDGIPSSQTTSGLDIDADTGNLLVALGNGSAATGVIEIATPGATPTFVDRHLTTVTPTAVAANPVTDEIIELIFFDSRVLILDNDGAPPASVTVGGATDVGTDGATLNATVGAPVGQLPIAYRIQYSRNGVDWTTAGSGTAPATGDPENVSAAATDLLPNTLYRVRVVADRTLGNPDVVSSEATFLTDGAAPTIVSSNVDLLSPGSVRLHGYVNSNSSPTSYRFEWGTNADALVNRIPVPNRQLGAGASPVLAQEIVSGLEPDTTYRYRLFATSPEGTTTTAVRSFTTRASSLPARAPELVSPAKKTSNGQVQDFLGSPAEIDYQIAPDGNSIFYVLGFGTPDSTAPGEMRYLAKRGPEGWSQTQMTPPLTTEALPGKSNTWAGRYGYMAPDLNCGVLKSTQPLTPDASTAVVPRDGANLFRRDVDGGYEWLTPEPENVSLVTGPTDISGSGGYVVMAASPDCRNVIFQTLYRFAGANDTGLYRAHNGVVTDVAVLPDGSPAPSPGLGSLPENGVRVSSRRAVSADASHLYFTATSNDGNDAGERALYLHREGQPTVKVSGSKTATVTRKPIFQIASTGGGKVAFMANYGLTPSSSDGPAATDCTSPPPQPCALYVYDVATDELVDVSATDDSANSNGATVGGVLGASDDLSRVYFAAQGQLVPDEGRTYARNKGASTATDDTYNLYLYTAGSGLSYVGLLADYDLNGGYGNALVTEPYGTTDVTPSGQSLLFTSTARNGGYDNAGIPEAYLYSADSDEAVCVSCRRDGEPPYASTKDLTTPIPNADIDTRDLVQPFVFKQQAGQGLSMAEPTAVSDHGDRVVFAMHDALTSDAVEGNQNIYLWDRGSLTLLDTGKQPIVPVFYVHAFRDQTPNVVGMSPSGDDVYIRTPSSLVPWDTDGVKDLYDFRVGGGFAGPPVPPAPCDALGDGCQGPGAGSINNKVASDGPVADGDAVAGDRQTLALSGLTASQRLRAARSGVLALRVSTSQAGVVRAVAQARIGARTRAIGRASKRARKAGVVTVGVRLSRAARARLRSGRALRVGVRVSQQGARARSMSVRLPGAGS